MMNARLGAGKYISDCSPPRGLARTRDDLLLSHMRAVRGVSMVACEAGEGEMVTGNDAGASFTIVRLCACCEQVLVDENKWLCRTCAHKRAALTRRMLAGWATLTPGGNNG